MAEVRYPYGYGTATATLEQLEARYGPGAPIPPHPEYWRRIKAWLIAQGGHIGIGGAFRFTQPSRPGFAPPGMSFHERQTFASGFSGYSAIDLVAKNGSERHRSPTWDEVPRQGSGHADIKNYGVHCNVSGEPWHIQCYEIDGFVRWRDAGRPDPRSGYPINGDTTPPPPTYKNDIPLPTLSEGSSGGQVRMLQGSCNFWGWNAGTVDGDFGSQTKAAVTRMQAAVRVGQDGVYGTQTAAAYDRFVTAMKNLDDPEPPPPTNDGVTNVKPCKYWVRPGDSPWAAAERVYGNGAEWEGNFTEEQFSKHSYHIPAPGTKGKRTKVRDGEGPYVILDRMGVDRGRLNTFYDWNGGKDRTLHPKDVVFMPT